MRTILILLVAAVSAHAQLAVKVSPVKIAGRKALVPLALENRLSEKVESARAVVFLLDEQGPALGQPMTHRVIGGRNTNGLAVSATNLFYFVVTTDKPFTTTNLTARASFSRAGFEDGKLFPLGGIAKQVTVTTAIKCQVILKGEHFFSRVAPPPPPPWRLRPVFPILRLPDELPNCQIPVTSGCHSLHLLACPDTR